MQFKSKLLNNLPEETKKQIALDLRNLGPRPTAIKHFENLKFSETALYQVLLREKKSLSEVAVSDPDSPRELTEEEAKILSEYKLGKIGYEEMHRLIAARALEQILTSRSDIKLADWLRSETLKLKKEQSEEAKSAMEGFLDNLFSGFLPSPTCPHCGKSTVVERKMLNVRSTILGSDTEDPAL